MFTKLESKNEFRKTLAGAKQAGATIEESGNMVLATIAKQTVFRASEKGVSGWVVVCNEKFYSR